MRRLQGLHVAMLSALVLAGCGGGTTSPSSGGGSLSNITRTGTFSLAFSGGGAPGVKHAWLTVYKVALNADANKPWDPTDTSWKVVTLATPVTFDIASPGGVLFSGLTVAEGTYDQIRLFLKPHDDTATPLASDGTSALTFKAQLEYESGGSVPIEIPNVSTGLKLDRGVTIVDSTLSYLTTHIDADRSVVRFNGNGSVDSVTLRPRTYTYGVSATTSGYIFGNIDPDYICGSLTPRSDCATDIDVSLHAPSGDGTRLENWGTYKVKPTGTQVQNGAPVTVNDGSFVLGPVSYTSTDNNPSSYDLVIRGRGMKTMVVKDVAYSVVQTQIGCSWSTSANDTASVYTYIRPTPDSTNRTVSLASPMAMKSARVGLGFKLGSDARPYEVHAANTDPFTGSLTTAAAMSVPSVSNGDVLTTTLATIKSACTGATPPVDLTIPFVATTQLEGVGGFTPFALGTFYTDAKLSSTAFTAGSTFTAQEPTAVVGAGTGTVDVSISGLPAAIGGFGSPKAQLIVSDVGGIVLTRDIRTTCSANPCTESVALPQGTASNGAATGVYEFAVRYWDASTQTTAKSSVLSGGTMRWARSTTFVNLRSATSGTASIAVP